MATLMTFYVNIEDPTVPRSLDPTKYLEVDLTHDYLIWTEGSDKVKDKMTHEPTIDELNEAASVISETEDVIVRKCLLMDYSHYGGFFTREVKKNTENPYNDNYRYVFCFRFDGATATEPRLEAWDNANHNSINKKVLGEGNPLLSFVKSVCTTYQEPGNLWSGVPLAGNDNYLLLNGGAGALEEAKDLYANLKIIIPANYSSPAAETFVLTIRYSYI